VDNGGAALFQGDVKKTHPRKSSWIIYLQLLKAKQCKIEKE
jgi:hypothetical protein